MSSPPVRLVAVLASVSLAALLATHIASAKGRFSVVIVTDLGTGEVRVVNDTELVASLALTDFANGTREAPMNGIDYAHSYNITRIAQGEEGRLFAVDRLRYEPPGSQSHGYVLYVGLVNGATEQDGLWFPAASAGDEAMDRLLSSPPGLPLTGVAPAAALGVASITLAAGFASGIAYQRRHLRAPQSQSHHLKEPEHRAA